MKIVVVAGKEASVSGFGKPTVDVSKYEEKKNARLLAHVLTRARTTSGIMMSF